MRYIVFLRDKRCELRERNLQIEHCNRILGLDKISIYKGYSEGTVTYVMVATWSSGEMEGEWKREESTSPNEILGV